MKQIAIIFLALLSVPAVSAYHLSSFNDPPEDQVWDTRNRVLATNTVNLDNAAAGNLMVFEFPWDPEYSFVDESHTIRIHISYTATFSSSSNGAWTIQVAKEVTGNLANCAVRVETADPVGISLDGLLVYAHYEWDCLFTQSQNPHYHYHTVTISRSVASGSPAAMTAEVVSVRLETEDVVITEVHVNEQIEFFNLLAPMIFMVLIVIWAELTREPLVYVLGVIAGVFATIALWDEIVSLRIILLGFLVLVAIRGILAALDMKAESQKAIG